MRTALTLALGLMLAASGGAFAGDKAINNVCPKSGHPADGSTVANVKDADGKTVTVATCSAGCKDKVVADPAKFAAAAKANKKAE